MARARRRVPRPLSPPAISLKGWFMMPSRVARAFSPIRQSNCDKPVEDVMQGLRDLTADIARRGHVPVTLGGEHSISYGAVMGVVDAVGPVGLIHVDAHADFRDAYQGHKFSHASVMHLLAGEGLPMVSLGVRALSVEEDAARKAHGVITHDARQLMRDGHARDNPAG